MESNDVGRHDVERGRLPLNSFDCYMASLDYKELYTVMKKWLALFQRNQDSSKCIFNNLS